MLNYTDNNSNKKTSNPVQSIVYSIIMFLSAPMRLFSEIGKKSIILGEYCEKFLLGVIILSTILLVTESLYSLTITKKLYVTSGSVSLVAIIISLVLNILLFVLFNRFRYDIDLDKLNDIDKDKAVDSIESIHKTSETSQDPNELSFEELEDLDYDSKPLVEKIEDDEISLDNSELLKLINESPKSSIDNLYIHESEEKNNRMNRELKKKMYGRCNPDEFENEELEITGKESLNDFAREIGFDEEEYLSNEIQLTETEEKDLVDTVHEQLTGHRPNSDDMLARLARAEFNDDDFE